MKIYYVTSCNRSMSKSWSLMNASSMAIRVGEVNPFMLSVAILRESIYSAVGGREVGQGGAVS